MKRGIVLSGVFAFLVLGQVSSISAAQRAILSKYIVQIVTDTAISAEIRLQLSQHKNDLGLYYPETVKHLYAQNTFQVMWTKPQTSTGKTWAAMLMIDCVLQFGLSHDDYHPRDLLYDKLHEILDKPEQVSPATKARFDIMLTDAIISFINHLHYGKLNPDFSDSKIDAGQTKFHAEDILAAAMNGKDFMSEIVKVQPKLKEYQDLQEYMRLVKGQYLDDCYEVPESDIRKVAINMERLRWLGLDEGSYIHVNIPSYTLKFHQPDTTYSFKVIVGKPGNHTPTLQSAITHFTTAPEWRVPQKIFVRELLPKALKDSNYFDNSHFTVYDKNGKYMGANAYRLPQVRRNPANYYVTQSSGCDNALGLVVFRFSNVFEIYLHDTPEQQLFKRDERAFSHGCIRVEQAEKLAALLLKNDNKGDKITAMYNAIAAYKTQTFTFKHPVPIMITYLTCEIKDGVLVNYKDIYKLDPSLEMAVYNLSEPLTMKN